MNKLLNIFGSVEKFEVNNIFCVGKNYLNHIIEFGQSEPPEMPVIFFKPNSALVQNNSVINVPEFCGAPVSNDVHYETEMVVAIGKDGLNIPESEAGEYIFGYAVGLDLTLRDLQSFAKKSGLPWGTAKGFYNSAPVGDIVPKNYIPDPMNCNLELKINNTIKQFSNTNLMILNIYKLISYISTIFMLCKGDLVFTGTPDGVGSLSIGDVLVAKLDDKYQLNVRFDG